MIQQMNFFDTEVL